MSHPINPNLTKPFSRAYSQDITDVGGPANTEPCCLCYRRMTGKGAGKLRVVDGGKRFAHPSETDINEAGDMGEWQVGACCLRRCPDLIPYLIPAQPVSKALPMPFSGPAFEGNNHKPLTVKTRGALPCVLCGNACLKPAGQLRVLCAGSFAKPGETYAEDDIQGVWPIGRDCLKNHPILKGYLVKD